MFLLCAMIAAVGQASFGMTNDVAAQSTQMIVVTTPDWNSIQGRLQRYERTSSAASWQPVGTAIPIVVGKNGVAWASGVVALHGVRAAADGAGVWYLGPTMHPVSRRMVIAGLAANFSRRLVIVLSTPHRRLLGRR